MLTPDFNNYDPQSVSGRFFLAMDNEEANTTQLLEIQKALGHRESLRAELRGGKAAFLYVRSLERAAEISIEQGGFFIEYWNDADEGSDSAPVKSETVASAGEVVNAMAAWFFR